MTKHVIMMQVLEISAPSPDGTDSGNAVTTLEAVSSKIMMMAVVVATTTATADTKTTTTSSDHSTMMMQNTISYFDVLLMMDEETGILNFYQRSLADGSGTAAMEEQHAGTFSGCQERTTG